MKKEKEVKSARLSTKGREGRLSAKVIFKRYWMLYVMLIPGFAYLLINNYLPIGGLVIAFKQIKFNLGIWESPWNGFENFKFLFKTSDAWIITRNTILYNLSFMVINTVSGLAIAILLNEIRCKFFKNAFQSVIMLPHLISYVIVGYLAYAFLNGSLGWFNKELLPLLGLDKVSWYQDASKWPGILLFVQNWKSAGYLSIVYFSAVVGINPSYYEAAAVDGASKWKQIWHITLPSLVPTIVTMLLLNATRIFYSDFGLFYQVPQDSGILYSTTQTIDVYVYNALLGSGNVGMSAAAGFYQSIVSFIVVVAANLMVRKKYPDSAIF